MTDEPRPLPDKSIQKVARLLEESSLGTVGARQLRDRAINGTAARIRCRAYFAANAADKRWWLENQYNELALRHRAQELAASGAHEISDLLIQVANGRVESGPPSAQEEAREQESPDWRSFRNFYDREIESFSRILRERTSLPEETAWTLIRQAMIKAFDEWESLAMLSDPGEWVIGYALQLYRRFKLPDEDDSWAPNDVPPASGSSEPPSPPMATQCTDVRVTGALAAAVAKVSLPEEDHLPAGSIPVRIAALENATLEREPFAASADAAVTRLYAAHYRPLVRIAALLILDKDIAEEVVQDSFVTLCRMWPQLSLMKEKQLLSYLRQCVVNRSRSVLRYRTVISGQYIPFASKPDLPSAEEDAISLLERSTVIAAMRALPARQREALVLRYYCDLPETDIAAIMGISRGAVKSHTARAMSALRSVLSVPPEPRSPID